MKKVRFIRVPKDEKAMKDYDYGVQKKEQMEEMILSEAQYKALEIVNQLINSNDNEELVELKNILNLAITYKTIVGFDF